MMMDLDSYLDNDGEWLKASGPFDSIAISTRVRMARNLAGRRFPTHPDQSERPEILREIHAALAASPSGKDFSWLEIDQKSPLDRLFLMERHLISREFADGSGLRAVAFNRNESLSIMVNEEDHLRMQCLRSGFRLRNAFEAVDRLDDELGERLRFAFDDKFGFLTSCPTNVGTGLRVSVMLHLPGLVMTRHIEKIFRAVYEMRMAVRGFYGEGTEAYGELYQISNQATCGKTEEDIVEDLEAVIASIIRYEEKARTKLLTQDVSVLEDRVWRSWGVLNNARMMSSEEAMKHLSSLRLGVVTGILKKPSLKDLNRLFLFSQPAHLQRMQGKELDSKDRDSARASFLRQKLAACRN